MAIEKKWPAVAPQLFTTNGGAQGQITVADARGFKVKQFVVIKATGLPDLRVQVKRVTRRANNDFLIIVGPPPEQQTQGKAGLRTTTDLSLYTTASGALLYAEEQDKNTIKPDDIMQAVWRQEPGTTIGVEIDDQFGRPIDSVIDSSGINRLAVDGQFHAEVDVQVDVDIDGFYDAITNPDPDNIALIGHLRSNPTNQSHQTQRITAIRGTVDTDNVSQDVSLHDHNGNKYDIANPVPVTGSFEKFFQLIGDSNWMKLGVYDSVTPTFSLDGRTLTLAYKETGNLIGEAIVVFNSNTDYSITLNRYINNDGEGLLLDDDDTPLNLD